MKSRVVMAIVLCTLSASCYERDTELRGGWVRTVEPRLSGVKWSDPRRLQRRYRQRGPCDTVVDTKEKAVHVLSYDLRCVDEAITRLEGLEQWSDLAAAYFIRARADAQQLDYLLALETADRAVRETPLNPAAQFNRGLIQETVGLYELAMLSYASLRSGDSEWAKEAIRRHDALRDKLAPNPLVPQLEEALQRGDAAAVRKIIEPFPVLAHEHLDNVVRPRGNPAQTRMLASALAERYGDQSFLEAPELAEEIRVTRDLATIDAYEKRAAHYPFLRARCAWLRGYVLGSRNDFLPALKWYESAEKQFRALGDAESIGAARFRHAGVLTKIGQPERAWQELLEVDQAILNPYHRQGYVGEIAAVVHDLRHPAVAVQYRQLVVQRVRNEIRAAGPGQEGVLVTLRGRLGMALRSLAEAEIEVGLFSRATVHLDDAMRYGEKEAPGVQRFLDARMAEVNGKRLREVSPQLAPTQFTRAIELTKPNER
ncbi:MAG TPA: hypothetical protein VM733_01060, partial [Thermoanaerobaculia bacterium]|nr:hypothetical protein [Thermoanaerobaculia bacterium]